MIKPKEKNKILGIMVSEKTEVKVWLDGSRDVLSTETINEILHCVFVDLQKDVVQCVYPKEVEPVIKESDFKYAEDKNNPRALTIEKWAMKDSASNLGPLSNSASSET